MQITFTAPLESHPHGRATILLVTVPDDESDLLSDLPVQRGGFGSIPCTARIGATSWRTSVFPDKSNYLLLIARKRAVAEELEVGEPVTVHLDLAADL